MPVPPPDARKRAGGGDLVAGEKRIHLGTGNVSIDPETRRFFSLRLSPENGYKKTNTFDHVKELFGKQASSQRLGRLVKQTFLQTKP